MRGRGTLRFIAFLLRLALLQGTERNDDSDDQHDKHGPRQRLVDSLVGIVQQAHQPRGYQRTHNGSKGVAGVHQVEVDGTVLSKENRGEGVVADFEKAETHPHHHKGDNDRNEVIHKGSNNAAEKAQRVTTNNGRLNAKAINHKSTYQTENDVAIPGHRY